MERDWVQALAWYEKGADAGDPNAMCNAGWCLENGWGSEKDPERACQRYQQAADREDVRGIAMVGRCLQQGIGVERDETAALSWFEKGAQMEDAGCLFCLGRAYEMGRGVERDMEKALEWYQKSAAEGSFNAQYMLGRLLEEQAPEKAAFWYKLYEKSGEDEVTPMCYIGLGRCLALGLDGTRDLEQAQAICQKAQEFSPWSYDEEDMSREEIQQELEALKGLIAANSELD